MLYGHKQSRKRQHRTRLSWINSENGPTQKWKWPFVPRRRKKVFGVFDQTEQSAALQTSSQIEQRQNFHCWRLRTQNIGLHKKMQLCEKSTHPKHSLRKCEVGDQRLHRRNNNSFELQNITDLCADCGNIFAKSALFGQRCDCHYCFEGISNQIGRRNQSNSEGGNHRYSAEGNAQRQIAGFRVGFRGSDVFQGNIW